MFIFPKGCFTLHKQKKRRFLKKYNNTFIIDFESVIAISVKFLAFGKNSILVFSEVDQCESHLIC